MYRAFYKFTYYEQSQAPAIKAIEIPKAVSPSRAAFGRFIAQSKMDRCQWCKNQFDCLKEVVRHVPACCAADRNTIGQDRNTYWDQKTWFCKLFNSYSRKASVLCDRPMARN